MNQEIIFAITNKRLVQFHYDGGTRVVEPHCYGITTAGNEGLRAFQVSGHSTSGKMGWKMFDLGKASSVKVLDTTFNGPRPDYKKGDKGMSQIFVEL